MFKALAVETRVKIIDLLKSEGPLGAKKISELLGITPAAGGDGLLEVDVNSNPLRENLARPMPVIKAGQLMLSDAPGLGVEPDLAGTGRYIVSQREIR